MFRKPGFFVVGSYKNKANGYNRQGGLTESQPEKKQISNFERRTRRYQMKKIGLIALLTLFGALLNFWVLPDTGMARIFRVFGPENFVRAVTGPAIEVREFQVQYPVDSEFDLHVFYGGLKKDFEGIVPSAVVTLNGRTVVVPNEFNRNIYHINKKVTLLETNSLSVELRGKPGSGVRVVIVGRNDDPQLFDFSRSVQPDCIGLLGKDLNYVWTILHQPEGGNAMLSDIHSLNPSFNVKRPGEYILNLTIRGSTWEESFPVKLTATLYPPFMPVPVETRIEFEVVAGGGYFGPPDYGMKIGPTTYERNFVPSCGSPYDSGFQVMVLDRATLEQKDYTTFNIPCGNQAMINYISSLSDTTKYPVAPLVIVSSLNMAKPYDVCGNSSACPLGHTLEGLGGTTVYSSRYSETMWINYSLIGIPGLGVSNGFELNSWDHKAYNYPDPKIDADIKGYFVQDTSGKWAFTYPEFVQIETQPQPTQTSNVIKVGNASYSSESLKSGATGGFQVLLLDRDSLQLPNYPLVISPNATFSTNATGSLSDSEQNAMYNYLTTLNNTLQNNAAWRFVVIFASIGDGPISTYKAACFPDLIKLIGNYYGGTTGILNNLGPKTDPSKISTYSLIGFHSIDPSPFGANDAVEASSPGVNLRVVLQKDKHGWFKPTITNPGTNAVAGGPDTSILSVALQPYTPWPLPNPALSTADPLYQRQLAAYQYISRWVYPLAVSPPDIRYYYTKEPTDPGSWLTNCFRSDFVYPSTAAFTEDDFIAMKNQLCGYHDAQGNPVPGEFDFVQAVNGFKTVMENNVWVNMKLSSSDRLGNVYAAVKPIVNPPSDHRVLYNMGIVIRGVLTAGTSIVTNPGLKAAMGIINGLMSMAMGLQKADNGTDYTLLDTKVSDLDNQMDGLWEKCQKGSDIALGIIKSDWGKLQYVGTKLMTPQSQGGWMWDDGDQYVWVDQMTDTLEAYYFQSLIPTLWKIDYMQNTTIPHPKNFSYYVGSCWSPCCYPYCSGASANDNAFWVDNFSIGSTYNYTWYVLEDKINMYASSGCGYVDLGHSSELRKVLFGQGPWLVNGVEVGINLNLPRPIFYERWLPSSVYTPYVAPIGVIHPTPYYHDCSS